MSRADLSEPLFHPFKFPCSTYFGISFACLEHGRMFGSQEDWFYSQRECCHAGICVNEGVSEPSFYAWRRALAARDRKREKAAQVVSQPATTHEFVPLKLIDVPATLEVVHPLGFQVRITGTVDTGALTQVLDLLKRLTVRERPGKTAFRFWQDVGPGPDRNLSTPEALLAAIDYIHNNPVKRGLCERSEQWKWSSARCLLGFDYESLELPRIVRLSPEWQDGMRHLVPETW